MRKIFGMFSLNEIRMHFKNKTIKLKLAIKINANLTSSIKWNFLFIHIKNKAIFQSSLYQHPIEIELKEASISL